MIRTISEHGQANLQTAVTVLDQTRSPRTVAIVSVIHIGLPSYYDELNALIARHNGAVLYEGIGSLTEDEIAALSPRERAIYERIAPLHDLYEKFADPLGLVFQGKALHYDREHWINADVPLKQLLSIWADRDLPPLPFENLPAELFEREANQKMAGAVLLQMPRILTLFNGLRGWIPTLRRFNDVLIEQRNQAAMAAFDAVPADQNALIIYGAGHAAGLLDALRERWYWRKSESWHTAFRAEAALDPFSRIKSLLGIG
ncbi:MAG TPA: hypothetical protein VH916_00130 [Dehalococcoidia bacterium]